MEILTQVQVMEQAVERDEPGKITENSYMEGSDKCLSIIRHTTVDVVVFYANIGRHPVTFGRRENF